LFYLGLADRIVGVTKFCVHPNQWVKGKAKVGGTKNVRFDVLDRLAPDLLVGNKEENDQGSILKLEANYPLWISDVSCYEEALQMILALGEITDKQAEAIALTDQIALLFSQLEVRKPCRVLYLIWKAPWMAAGKKTFIDSMLSKMGLVNVVEEARYPTISENQLRQLQPELIFLSSEPYPFKQTHSQALQMAMPGSKIILVDGELFSWYGNRMLLAPGYFNSLDW
jgi:ABC-type Fe3+-hydroxamate transport system substrate-binding protein